MCAHALTHASARCLSVRMLRKRNSLLPLPQLVATLAAARTSSRLPCADFEAEGSPCTVVAGPSPPFWVACCVGALWSSPCAERGCRGLHHGRRCLPCCNQTTGSRWFKGHGLVRGRSRPGDLPSPPSPSNSSRYGAERKNSGRTVGGATVCVCAHFTRGTGKAVE